MIIIEKFGLIFVQHDLISMRTNASI